MPNSDSSGLGPAWNWVMEYGCNSLDDPILMTWPIHLLSKFGIWHRLENCEISMGPQLLAYSNIHLSTWKSQLRKISNHCVCSSPLGLITTIHGSFIFFLPNVEESYECGGALLLYTLLFFDPERPKWKTTTRAKRLHSWILKEEKNMCCLNLCKRSNKVEINASTGISCIAHRAKNRSF